MNYINGLTIKNLREAKKLTQAQLADMIGVSDKAVSKWETLRGLPDITLLPSLAQSLGVSMSELMEGKNIVNKNIGSNMLRSKLYICPLCGNIIHSMGEVSISCCGQRLECETAESSIESEHEIKVERIENDYFVSVNHPMTKEHYISFLAYVTNDRFNIVKLYPEGEASARFHINGRGVIYAYCNHHSLFSTKI